MKKFLSSLWDYLKRSDSLLLCLCLLATAYGMLLIKSATTAYGSQYLIIQMIALIIGLFLYFIFSLIDVDIIAEKSTLLFIFSAAFIGSLVFFGVAGDSGNSSWIRFGPVGIQPAEIVKIPFIIMMARLITHQDYNRGINDKISVLQSVMLFGFFFVLIVAVSSDLGSALVYFFIFAVMMFVAGLSLKWIFAGVILLTGVMPLVWNFFLSEGQKT